MHIKPLTVKKILFIIPDLFLSPGGLREIYAKIPAGKEPDYYRNSEAQQKKFEPR